MSMGEFVEVATPGHFFIHYTFAECIISMSIFIYSKSEIFYIDQIPYCQSPT